MCLNYLAEGGALGHNDVKLALACSCVLEKSLDCPRAADGHDDLFGVDVLQCLHRNVVGGPLWDDTEINTIVTTDEINLHRRDNYCISFNLFSERQLQFCTAFARHHMHAQRSKVKYNFSQ